MNPIYDPQLSYEQNYADGPFGAFADPGSVTRAGDPVHSFFGLPVYNPFGIPAGPLLNSAFTTAAFRSGFDVCVYKTVRSGAYPCNPFPNVLAVRVDGPLTPEKAVEPLLADTDYSEPLSISNSFGVPSRDPDVWQPDMARAVDEAGRGQILVGSFQGTKSDGRGVGDTYVADHIRAARLVVETGAPVVELNLSCPNEGTSDLLCFDTPRVRSIVEAVKETIGNIPLILKLAYFRDDEALRGLITATRPFANGYAAINTIPARLVDRSGAQALPGAGRAISGVCGASITWAGLEMVDRLATLREELDADYSIIGVGGAGTASAYRDYRTAGADVVMSATGAMWHPELARELFGLT